MSALAMAPAHGSEAAVDGTRRRGTTVLAAQVVEKIAAQAAAEIDGAGGRSGGVLGVGRHVDLDARPQVQVELRGRSARLSLKLSVAYPTSLAAAAEQVRTHVVRSVAALAGVEVTRLDVDVVAVRRPGPDQRKAGLA